MVIMALHAEPFNLFLKKRETASVVSLYITYSHLHSLSIWSIPNWFTLKTDMYFKHYSMALMMTSTLMEIKFNKKHHLV